MKFKKRTNYRNYLYSWPVIIFILILVALSVRGVVERFIVEREMSERRIHSELKYEQLNIQKVRMEKQVTHLEGDRGIEETIRRNFDVALEGEQVIVLIGEEEVAVDMHTKPTPNIYPWYIFWK